MASIVQKDISTKVGRVTPAGQISLPAPIRRRWGTKTVRVEDHGDHVVVRPLPDDPIAAARGSLRGHATDAAALRRRARQEDSAAERRR